MQKQNKIYVAGHRGLVGSAIVRALQAQGYNNLILRAHKELDLLDQKTVTDFFQKEKLFLVIYFNVKVKLLVFILMKIFY